MPIRAVPGQPLQDGPAVPGGVTPLRLRGFVGGLNTEASRPAINDNQLAWCDGWFPLGDGNLRTCWGLSGKVYNPAALGDIVAFDTGVIGNTPWIIVFRGDGRLVAVNYATGSNMVIGSRGTITNPVRGTFGIGSWGSDFIIIVAQQPDGYWVFDGVTLYAAGDVLPGAPGTVTPAAVVVGSIAQADGVGTVSGSVLTLTQWNYGSFGAGQTIVGAGVTAGSVITTQATGTTGQIGTYNLSMSSSVGSPVEISVAGTLLNVTQVVSGVLVGGNEISGSGVTVGTTVTGQVSGTTGGVGVYTVSVSQLVPAGTTITVGNFYSDTVPTGVSGSAVETYAGRVWVANGNTVSYTSPGSLTDNNPQNGAGSFTSTDSFLRSQYVALRQTNGFLYLICDSSISYLSGVQTSGSPLQTTFTNQNADPEIGTPFGDAVDVFSRNIVLANTWGVHLSYGGSVAKVSDALDGVYTSAPLPMLAQPPSGAKAILFGKKVWMVLVPTVDPFSGQVVSRLFLWDSKKWFSSLQDLALVYVRGLEIGSDLIAFGTDGNDIYQLFANPSSGFEKVVQSKLWADEAGGLLTTKTAERWWGCVNFYSNVSETLSVSVDSDLVTYPATDGSSAQFLVTVPVVSVVWYNETADVVVWTNAGSAQVTWTASGAVGPYVFGPQRTAQNGTLIGMTISTMAADVALVEASVDGEFFGYRG